MNEDYTDTDVRKLVSEVEQAFDWVTNHGGQLTQYTGHTMCIVDALKPFRADPEEGLRQKVDMIRASEGGLTGSTLKIIAAVREHDAKHAKGSPR